jgi:hypothetical protein
VTMQTEYHWFIPGPNGIVSPVVRARVIAGRSTTRTSTTRSESWSGRVNSPPPPVEVLFSHSVRTFAPREEWHVRGECWAQAGQSRPYRALGATLAPVPAERVVPRFRYHYLHRVLSHQKKTRSGWNCFPPDSLRWTPPLALCRPPVRGLMGDALWRGMLCTA